ncbi:MAG: hypothetical protein ACLSFT_05575 [Ruminococcus callidus]
MTHGTALLIAAEKAAFPEKPCSARTLSSTWSFDSETRRMAVTVTDGAGTCTSGKGLLMSFCPCADSRQDGKSVPLRGCTSRCPQTGRRHVRRSPAGAGVRQTGRQCRIFLGLWHADPPRESARTAIRTCARRISAPS